MFWLESIYARLHKSGLITFLKWREGKYTCIRYAPVRDNKCNLCKYCFVSIKKTYGKLGKKARRKVIKAINSRDDLDLILFGEKAETGINIDQIKALKELKENTNKRIKITTKIVDNIEQYIKPNDNVHIAISITNVNNKKGLEKCKSATYRLNKGIELYNKGYSISFRYICINPKDIPVIKAMINLTKELGMDLENTIVSTLRLEEEQLKEMNKYTNIKRYICVGGMGKANYTDIKLLNDLVNSLKDIKQVLFDVRNKNKINELCNEFGINTNRFIQVINKRKCQYDARRNCLHSKNFHKCREKNCINKKE